MKGCFPEDHMLRFHIWVRTSQQIINIRDSCKTISERGVEHIFCCCIGYCGH